MGPTKGLHVARSDAAKKADAKYKAEKTKQLVIRFYPGDDGILEHLQEQGSKQDYIKQLIRRDMESADAYDIVAGEHVISTEALHDLLDEWDRHPGRAATDQEMMALSIGKLRGQLGKANTMHVLESMRNIASQAVEAVDRAQSREKAERILNGSSHGQEQD